MALEPINLDRETHRRWPFLLRAILFAMLVSGVFLAGWATARRGMEDGEQQVVVLKQALGEEHANALMAKEAVLQLMRQRPASFEGCDPEELASMALTKMENDGMWSFGENTIDLHQLTYKCTWFYMADRLEGFEYEGTLILDGHHWAARSPKKSRVRYRHDTLEEKT